MLTKKTLLGFFVIVLITACNTKKTVDDIKLDDIKTPCDLMDAYEVYWSDYQMFVDKESESLRGVDELSETEKNRLEDGFYKFEKMGKNLIEIQLDESWIDKDFYDCDEGRSRFADIEEMAEKCARRQTKLRSLLNSPDQTAIDYLTALMEKNYTKAKELGTKNTQDMLDALTSMNMAPVIKEVKDVKCTEEGDKAICKYCCAKDGKNSISLVKEGDKWLVDEKKEGGTQLEDAN